MSAIHNIWKKTRTYARWIIALSIIAISVNVAAFAFTLTTDGDGRIFAIVFAILALVSATLLIIGIGLHGRASPHLVKP